MSTRPALTDPCVSYLMKTGGAIRTVCPKLIPSAHVHAAWAEGMSFWQAVLISLIGFHEVAYTGICECKLLDMSRGYEFLTDCPN